MGRVACYFVLFMMWSSCLHAEEQLSNERRSTLRWLKLDSLSATRERPLFAPDRRQPAPPPVATAPGQPEPVTPKAQGPQKPQLVLTGIIVSPAETTVLLRDPSTSESVVVHAGDTVGHWRVLVDSNYAVTLKDGAREFRLEMFAEP
jgi:general secretion pathway protein N